MASDTFTVRTAAIAATISAFVHTAPNVSSGEVSAKRPSMSISASGAG